MKRIEIDSLLATPRDGAVFQTEWTAKGQHGKRGILLEIALFAGAVGPGLYIASWLSDFLFGMAASFLFVVVGYGLTHLFFLGRVERFWRGMLRPHTSWISRGFIFANLYLLFALLTIVHYCPLMSVDVLRPGASLFKTLAIAGTVSAVLLTAYPGFLFSVLQAIPFWHSIMLVPLFLIQSLHGGLALLFICAQFPGVSAPELRPLLQLDLVLLAVTAVLITGHFQTRRKSGRAGEFSANQLLRGKYKGLFLGGAVVSGLILPAVLLGSAIIVLNPILLVAGSLLQLGGVLLFKYCLLNAGAYSELCNEQVFASIYK